MSETQTFYDAVGGSDFFFNLVDRFYREVAADPILRPMYPEEDLTPAQIRFQLFLEQYWGGPRTYSDQRGHPRLRMRHAPFTIGPIARDAWLRCMHIALAEIPEAQLDATHRAQLTNYFTSAADSLMNSPL